MLSRFRVLDLSDQRGMLCGQILADLGADVIQVEPRGGSPARRLAPFHADTIEAEGSLVWWSQARGKRSVVLDLDEPSDQQTLRNLARNADFLIESEQPGVMSRRGLGYDDLAAIHPGLIYVSITPFGQDGPKAQWAAGDLQVLASSGALILNGDADRAPVRISTPQSGLHAASDAAVGALLALHERHRSGLGQHVDVSAQESSAACTQASILCAAGGESSPERRAGGLRIGPTLDMRYVFPAKDGHVSITLMFGSTLGQPTRRLMEWVHEEGFCDAATRDKDWLGYTELLQSGDEPTEEWERVKALVGTFTATKTKAELFQASFERKLLIAPVQTVQEVVESDHSAARKFFVGVTHEDIGRSFLYPGPFARFGACATRHGIRAPHLDEHGDALRSEAASSPASATATPAPSAPQEPKRRELPLAGLKIVDFMWALAGPATTRILSDFGATVIRLESTTRLDVARTLRPFLQGNPGNESSMIFHTMNAGKRMVTVDLTTEAGQELIRDLVSWADVVTESFSPGVMSKIGFGYDELREIKPDIIMLSTCLMGQTGPLAGLAGYGNLAGAMAGFYELTGWPDRSPAGPFAAYTDYVAPRYNAIAILAALEHRRRTGEGQVIDLSQLESSLHFLAPAILDYTVNGRSFRRIGNADLNYAPHGVYPAAGEDRWVAISAETETQWRDLCDVLQQPELTDDARFASIERRMDNAAALDAVISAFTGQRDMFETEQLLQARGVPACAVLNSPDLIEDPQLTHRGYFVELAHPEGGSTTIERSRVLLSATPARIDRPAPTMGDSIEWVMHEALGYDDDKIAELIIGGALG